MPEEESISRKDCLVHRSVNKHVQGKILRGHTPGKAVWHRNQVTAFTNLVNILGHCADLQTVKVLSGSQLSRNPWSPFYNNARDKEWTVKPQRADGSVWEYRVSNFETMCTKIIPFFEQHPLYTYKKFDFLRVRSASLLIRRGLHLTPAGLEKIVKMREKINQVHPVQSTLKIQQRRDWLMSNL